MTALERGTTPTELTDEQAAKLAEIIAALERAGITLVPVNDDGTTGTIQ